MTGERWSEGFYPGRPAPAAHRKSPDHAHSSISSLLFLTLQMSSGSFITSSATLLAIWEKLPNLPSGPWSRSVFLSYWESFCVQPHVVRPELCNPPLKAFALAKFPAFFSQSVSNHCLLSLGFFLFFFPAKLIIMKIGYRKPEKILQYTLSSLHQIQ